jgi:membrane-associated phospholipid phosphatase
MTTDRRTRLFPFDYLILGYCAGMMLLIALIGRPLSMYYDELIAYASIGALTALIINYTREDGRTLSRFLRLCYPAILFTVFYRLTGGTMFLLHSQAFDWQLTTFERLILGVNPTLYIDQHLLHVVPTEIFMFCYFCYYLMIPAAVLYLFATRKDDQLKELLTAICLTFFLSYPIFFIYPIEGPRWYFAMVYQHPIDGLIFRKAVNFIIANGAVRGGCVPSTHVAVALVISLFGMRYWRPVGRILMVITVGLAIGTFWGRFHYVSDIVIGVLIAVPATLAVWKYWPVLTRPR